MLLRHELIAKHREPMELCTWRHRRYDGVPSTKGCSLASIAMVFQHGHHVIAILIYLLGLIAYAPLGRLISHIHGLSV